MQTQIKRYNLLLRGKVQHIGYRGIIEGAARKLDMKGYVFNDIDGSVKIVCEGLQRSVDAFINDIKEFARSDIESIEKKEIHEELYLPSVFSRVASDEYYEFSKKFDIGIDLLDGIKTDTGEMKGSLGEMKSTLGEMKGTLGEVKGTLGEMKGTLGEVKGTLGEMKGTLGEMKGSLNSIDNTLGTFVVEQREHNKRMDEHNQGLKEHNQRLEKILEKLAGR